MMFHFRLITLAYHFDHNLTDTIIFLLGAYNNNLLGI